MLLLAIEALPRGGVITMTAEGTGFMVRAKGDRAKLKEAMVAVIDGASDLATLDARLIQPYYARMLSHAQKLKLSMAMEAEDTVAVSAVPV
jgi:histidine phosphotransferase ChpT